VAAEGEWCDGDDGLRPWSPNSIRLSERILVSALDLWRVGFTGNRTGAGVESSPASPPGSSVVTRGDGRPQRLRALAPGRTDTTIAPSMTVRVDSQTRCHTRLCCTPLCVPWLRAVGQRET
jgi:hypothetical protein